MITAKKLKEFLQGVPDDADIYIPSPKGNDVWDELTSVEIYHDADYSMILMNSEKG